MSPVDFKTERAIVEKWQKAISQTLQTDKWSLKNVTAKCAWDAKFDTGEYRLEVVLGNALPPNDRLAAKFSLVQMPGCCGVCISTGASVMPEFTHKGLGRVLNSLRIDLARAMGYSVLLCTDVDTNEAQRKILQANGWRDIYKFINARTKNTVNISIIGL